MQSLLPAAILFLCLTVVIGFFRILRGPSRADCMMGVQLLGTAGVAGLLLLSRWLRQDSLLDMALLLALLAAISSSAFVAFSGRGAQARFPDGAKPGDADAAADSRADRQKPDNSP